MYKFVGRKKELSAWQNEWLLWIGNFRDFFQKVDDDEVLNCDDGFGQSLMDF